MKKKIISAVLAGACAVSAMAISSYAVDGEASIVLPDENGTPAVLFPDSGGSVSVSDGGTMTLSANAGVIVAAIDVTVPSSITAYINPYNIAVKDKSGKTYISDGVSSPLYTIVNKTAGNRVAVTAKATLTVPTEKDPNSTSGKATLPSIDIVSSAGNTKLTSGSDKAMYVAAAFSGSSDPTPIVKPGEEGTVNANSGGAIVPTMLEPMLDMTKDTTGVVKSLAFTDVTVIKGEDGKAVTTPTGPSYETMVVLDAPGAGKFTYAQFQITGKINTKGNWTSKDKVSVTLIFNIAPTGDIATPATPIQ